MREAIPDAAHALLRRIDLDDAEAVALKGDLSARRYLRLSRAERSAILMIVPTAGREVVARVIDRTRRLAEAGSSVPAILAADPEAGLAVVEDFGDLHLADRLRGGEAPAPLLSLAIEALGDVRRARTDGLETPDAAGLVGLLDILDDWLPGADASALADLRAALTAHLDAVLVTPPVFSLRDAHAENIIWLGDRHGPAQVGLIDFQDAIATHPMYDVASLLRDARIDIADEVVEPLLARAARSAGLDVEEARKAFDLLTIQRNLRIAAIFRRSAMRDGKSAHLIHLPRVRGHIARAARTPGLADLAAILRHVLPGEVTPA